MKPRAARTMVIAGFALHLVIGFFYLGAGLLAPPPAVAGLMAVWVALLVLAVVRRRHPWYVLATPFVAAAIWFVTLTIGDAFFGWTA